MKLVESEKANPQDYFLQSGVDEQGNPVYDLLNDEVTDYSPARAFRKKVFDGNADIVVLADTIQIYWKGNLIAEAQLDGQVETSPGVWQGQLFSFADANISKITEVPGTDHEGNPIMVPITPFFRAYVVKDIPALGITDAVLGLDVHWAFKDTKLSFYLDAPGFNARIRWQCRVKDSAVAWLEETGDPYHPIHHKGLQFSVSDYQGEVNHGSQADLEPGWTQHWWTFEPSGKLCDVADARTPLERYQQGVGLVVDPYLGIDQQSTYIDILCDGYVCRVYTDDTHASILSVFNTALTTELMSGGQVFYDSSLAYWYRFGFDTSRVTTIIENTPNRVQLRIKGRLDRTSGATSDYLTNLTYIEMVATIYPDRYMTDQVWVCSAAIVHDSGDYAFIAAAYGIPDSLTSEDSVGESSGSEISLSLDTNYNSADYFGFTATELDAILVILYNSGFLYDQWSGTADGAIFARTNDDIPSGTSRIISVNIMDSASRQGSAKLYNSTDRLAMGDQYKDPFGFEEVLGSEIVVNGTMETGTGPDNWLDWGTPTTSERSLEQAHGDTYSNKLICDSDADGTRQILTLTEGKIYKFDGYIYISALTASGIDFGIYDNVSWLGRERVSATGSWQQVTFYFVASSSSVIKAIAVQSGAGSSTFYIDDVSVKEVQDPTKGNYVTDLILPIPINPNQGQSGGGPIGTLHSDGAHHYDPNLEPSVKLTLDRTRIRPAFVVHDWPFQYIPLNVSGSVSAWTIKLSFEADNAFVDFAAAGLLTPYLDYKLTIYDGANKALVGYIKAVGTGETYGSELLANTSLEDLTGISATNGGTVSSVAGGQSGNCVQISKSGDYANATQSFTAAAGCLYRYTGYGKRGTDTEFWAEIGQWDGSNYHVVVGFWSDSTSWTPFDKYGCTAPGEQGTSVNLQTTDGTNLWDTISCKKVLTPSATGVTIVSSLGGSSYNWASEESGFERHSQTGYTYLLEPMAPVSILLNHLKMDDNAATPHLLDRRGGLVLFEGFEGTGYEQSWTPTESGGGALDEDKATSTVSGAPARWGDSCLEVSVVASAAAYIHMNNVGLAESWISFEFIISAESLSLYQTTGIFNSWDGSFNAIFSLSIQEQGTAQFSFYTQVYHDGSLNTYYSLITNYGLNTPIHFEFKWDVANHAWAWRIDGVNQPNDVDDSSPVTSEGTLSGSHAETTDKIRFGTVVGVAAVTYNMDNIRVNNLDWAGIPKNGTWRLISDGSARNTSNDSVATDNFRGRALDTTGGISFAEMEDGVVHTNAFFLKGSVLIKFTPQFIYTGGGDIVTLMLGASNYLSFWYSASALKFNCKWGGTSGADLALAFTANYSLQRPMTALLFWDSDKDFYGFAIDGKVIATTILTAVPATSSIYQFYIGCWQDRASPSDIIIDEIKTFSECVLPFGSFHIGNGSGLLADIDNPHADLCFFWDCQDVGAGKCAGGTNLATSKDIWGSGSPTLTTTDALIGTYCMDTQGIDTGKYTVGVSSADIIDGSKGSVLIWVNPQSYNSTSKTWWSYRISDSYRIYLQFDVSNNVYFRYTSNGVNEDISSGISLTTGKWACVRATWDDSDKTHLYINKIEYGTPQTIANPWSGTGGGIAMGGIYGATDDADVKIGKVFISKDPNTPEIWTAFGKPLHTPRIDLT